MGQQQCAGEATFQKKHTNRLDELDKKDETVPTKLCWGEDHPESTEGYKGQSSPNYATVAQL